MKTMVLGGSGAMARAIIHHLVDSPSVSEVLVADINHEKALEVVQALGSPKLKALRVDASDVEGTAEAMRGVDVVANATVYKLNLHVMKSCLASGTHYVDLGGLYHLTKEQVKLNGQFRDAGLTAVLCMGASPGITNMAAKKGAGALDAVEEIHIRTGARGGKGFAYSAVTILDEVTMNPVIFEDGDFKVVEPLSGRQRYTLPEPVGEVEGFYSIHSELATLPLHIEGVKTVTFRVAFSPALLTMMDSLVALGFLSDDPVEIQGRMVTPKEFTYRHLGRFPEATGMDENKSFRVSVLGTLGGQRVEKRYETLVVSDPVRSLRATARWTGYPAAIVMELIGEGQISKRGVFAPEQVVPVEEFFGRLSQAGIDVMESTHPA